MQNSQSHLAYLGAGARDRDAGIATRRACDREAAYRSLRPRTHAGAERQPETRLAAADRRQTARRSADRRDQAERSWSTSCRCAANSKPIAAALVAEHATDEQRARADRAAPAAMGGLCRQRRSCCVLRGRQSVRRNSRRSLPERLHHGRRSGPCRRIHARLWYSTANPDRMDRSISLHVAVIRADSARARQPNRARPWQP